MCGSGSTENRSGFSTYSLESYGSGKNDGLFSMNTKETMMVLNDRLATYLEKVASLEMENQRLERKIKVWYEKNVPQQLPDNSKYLKVIEELQKEILDARIKNNRVFLHIDNARLAGDDLQTKYNMELSLHNTIEADVVDLRKGLDGLTLERCELEFQLEQLSEDLILLKKNHNEEVDNLKEQLGARIHVEVDVAPAKDINKVLASIRNEYESLMERNLKDVEKWFVTQSEELNSQMVSGAEHLQTVKYEVIDLNHTIQNLEIDLQTQLNTVG
ncbi:PREDICTED: keratin, type I cuticular Ha6-like [Nanorana parkeri]|uniref:keratin, type I cuticular Ha6-like n=1 Tax=Nanorana parkeri TaxID=125878 RepID=UPI00085421DB|nr:PREDICTED: keratin, type I cuticular Ha6-like [Nanorana parkeri]